MVDVENGLLPLRLPSFTALDVSKVNEHFATSLRSRKPFPLFLKQCCSLLLAVVRYG